ncbi:MAG TPA: FAD-linked oxidase C-terminal domain-containing protein, partial [Planctomycetaceae bacterium]|nr:FAD-linked oxidase C-terminal domain-containing protein [Planctomycetaceae bacterium]
FHGTEAGVVEQAEMVQEIARENGGLDFQWATKPEERTKLWEARHNAYFACLQLKAGSRAISTDVCVPISRLAECIVETTKDIEKASMPIPLFGHVGDGNYHVVFVIEAGNPAELAEVEALGRQIVADALAVGGTSTGEHGIGLGKLDALAQEHPDALDVMRSLKRALDPHNLMNPGKVVPEKSG